MWTASEARELDAYRNCSDRRLQLEPKRESRIVLTTPIASRKTNDLDYAAYPGGSNSLLERVGELGLGLVLGVTGTTSGLNVDEHVENGEIRSKQCILRAVRYFVTVTNRGFSVHLDMDVHQEREPTPSHSHLINAQDSPDGTGQLPDSIMNLGCRSLVKNRTRR